MAEHVAEFEVLGPWSLQTSRRFWEGFTPAALPGEPAGPGLRTVFCAEGDWRRAAAEVTPRPGIPRAWCGPATVILTRPPDRYAGPWRWTSTGVAGRRWAVRTR
jgi:hypothetical protein